MYKRQVSGSDIPSSALLLDNGATIHCAKTLRGAIPGTFVEDSSNEPISVGDSGSSLTTLGSYLYALKLTAADGSSVDVVRRCNYTPDVVCNIMSEAVEVYQHGASFQYDVGPHDQARRGGIARLW